uniref:Uncharacterized protein n=1 Tax=Mucochytrium quahogii TaxID=96639 RepID=A0A7S2R6N4_9STRA|mmetsp:Transcript_14957/g.26164  ORF Transcript_14957/g.26164 Transcript_14957/m.26164 type:complete len:156 (-) Transcript_14957:3497-3964(-)
MVCELSVRGLRKAGRAGRGGGLLAALEQLGPGGAGSRVIVRRSVRTCKWLGQKGRSTNSRVGVEWVQAKPRWISSVSGSQWRPEKPLVSVDAYGAGDDAQWVFSSQARVRSLETGPRVFARPACLCRSKTLGSFSRSITRYWILIITTCTDRHPP